VHIYLCMRESQKATQILGGNILCIFVHICLCIFACACLLVHEGKQKSNADFRGKHTCTKLYNKYTY